MIQLPIDPYWHNAASWWLEHDRGNITEYHQWLAGQGIVGLPRAQFSDYLEFKHEEDALLFRLRWA